MEAVDKYIPHDGFFGRPYIDLDEQRGHPLAHRYLHGGFEGTDARFSMYLPGTEVYRGRLLQTFGGALGGDEHSVSTLDPNFALPYTAMHNAFLNGAYLIESNQGHLGADMSGIRGDMSILNWRTDAETARLSHAVAAEVYGAAPHHSYVYGGSGGGNRSLSTLEAAPEIWHGGVPYMFGGSPFSAAMNAARLLRPELDRVLDALAPGGSGNPFDGLDTEQRDALADLYRLGFQRNGEFQLRLPMPEVSWPSARAMEGLRVSDPTYVDDFWTKPGYAGADGYVRAGIVHSQATVSGLLTPSEIGERLGPSHNLAARLVVRFMGAFAADAPIGLTLTGVDAADLTCATLTLLSGASTGRSLITFLVLGDVLIPAGEGSFFDANLLDGIAVGDEAEVDNRAFIAYCHYHRYARGDDVCDPFAVAGVPVYPVRGGSVVPSTGGFTGDFGSSKMILIQHVIDRPCWAPAAVRYQRSVDGRLGDRADDHFRLWWSRNATHIPSVWEGGRISTISIDYTGIIAQAIRDVIAWVEEGVAPPANVAHVWRDGQLAIPEDAARIGGIQPVVRATVNGVAASEVAVGEAVRLEFSAEAPPGTGAVVAAEWDFDGSGSWPVRQAGIGGRPGPVSASIEHAWDAPGTYFATVRVQANRDGNVEASTHLIENIARVRVVVR